MQSGEGKIEGPDNDAIAATEVPSKAKVAEPEFDPKQFEKLGIELAPLAIFFLVNWKFGIFYATGIFMVATAAALAATWIRHKKIAVMPVVTGVFVLIFGGLTLYLQNEAFIKLKPTLVNLFFAAILFYGLMVNKPLLKIVLGEAISLTEEGWRQLTWRWAGFFVVLAGLNELVWRSFSTDTWVSFKFFGIMPLTLVFGIAQIGLIRRYALAPAPPDRS